MDNEISLIDFIMQANIKVPSSLLAHVTANMLVALVISYFINSGVSQMHGFILGGEYAAEGTFTYAAFLNIQCMDFKLRPAASWRCGSAILNQYLTLTAAHCLVPDMCEDIAIAVSVGHVNRLKGAIGSAYSYLIHDGYDSDITNDIGLVKLKHPLIFGSRISRVMIMPNPPYNERAEVAGWGRINLKKQTLTDYLKYTYYYVLQENFCLNLLDDLPKGTFCAGSASKGSHLYYGDSGSALVVRGYIQIGISSYLKPGITESVAIFTDVGYYYHWIQENADRILCDD